MTNWLLEVETFGGVQCKAAMGGARAIYHRFGQGATGICSSSGLHNDGLTGDFDLR